MEARRLYARAERWTDAFRASHPDRVPFTFWMYWRNRYPRDAGLRIDHLLLNAERAPALRSAGVNRNVRGRTGASDHAPAWIELDIPGASAFQRRFPGESQHKGTMQAGDGGAASAA